MRARLRVPQEELVLIRSAIAGGVTTEQQLSDQLGASAVKAALAGRPISDHTHYRLRKLCGLPLLSRRSPAGEGGV